MATRAANIGTRLDAIAVELAAMSATTAGGLPDAPGSAEHIRYRMSLIEEQDRLLAALTKLEGSFEVTSELSA